MRRLFGTREGALAATFCRRRRFPEPHLRSTGVLAIRGWRDSRDSQGGSDLLTAVRRTGNLLIGVVVCSMVGRPVCFEI